MRKRNLLLAIALLIFLVWLYFSNPISLLNLISTAKYEYIALCFFLFFLSIAIRTIRWKMFLKDAGVNINFFVALTTLVAGMFVSIYTPGRVAEPMRGYFLKQKSGTRISKVVSLVLVERVIDLIIILSLSFIFFITTEFSFPPEISSALKLASVIAAAIVATILLILKRDVGEGLIRVLSKLDLFKKRRIQMKEQLENFYNSISIIRKRTILLSAILAVAIWISEGLILFLSALSLGYEIPVIFAIGTMSFSQIIGLISSLPGGLGSTETVMTALLFSNMKDLQIASAATLIYRISTLWLITVMGFAAVTLFFRKPQEDKEEKVESEKKKLK